MCVEGGGGEVKVGQTKKKNQKEEGVLGNKRVMLSCFFSLLQISDLL